MGTKSNIFVVGCVLLLLFLFVMNSDALGIQATVIDDEGDKYSIADLKTYGSAHDTWRQEPSVSIEEIVYSLKIAGKKTYERVPFSEIKEISFKHSSPSSPQENERDEDVIYMQIVKRNGDTIDVDYRAQKVLKKSKDGKTAEYETEESETCPSLIGDVKVEGKQLQWRGFIGKEIISGGGRGIFVIHRSLVKKIVFQHPEKAQAIPSKDKKGK
jgi:hypothetical protein